MFADTTAASKPSCFRTPNDSAHSQIDRLGQVIPPDGHPLDRTVDFGQRLVYLKNAKAPSASGLALTLVKSRWYGKEAYRFPLTSGLPYMSQAAQSGNRFPAIDSP